MTTQKAIEAITEFRLLAHGHAVLAEALDMAIKALSETKRDLSEDTIYRQDAIDAMCAVNDSICGQQAIDALCELPSAQPEQRWIPCSERLPEEYGEYRITWKTSYAPNRRFIGDCEYEVSSEWDIEHDRWKGQWLLADYVKAYPDVEVIAWKPLEEPYKGVDNE